MSNFAENRENKAERKKQQWERKQINAKLYHDLAKLAFAALVLGQIQAINNGESDILSLVTGVLLTIGFIVLGNNFIKT